MKPGGNGHHHYISQICKRSADKKTLYDLKWSIMNVAYILTNVSKP